MQKESVFCVPNQRAMLRKLRTPLIATGQVAARGQNASGDGWVLFCVRIAFGCTWDDAFYSHARQTVGDRQSKYLG